MCPQLLTTGQGFHKFRWRKNRRVEDWRLAAYDSNDLPKGGEMRRHVGDCDCFRRLSFDLNDKEWINSIRFSAQAAFVAPDELRIRVPLESEVTWLPANF